MKQKEKELGVYVFGPHAFRVVITPGRNGAFYLRGTDEEIQLPTIEIGIEWEQDQFNECIAVVIHELLETLMSFMGFRYAPAPYYTNSHDIYQFHLDHKQFSELIDRLCWRDFLKLFDDLKREFDAQFKKKGKRK